MEYAKKFESELLKEETNYTLKESSVGKPTYTLHLDKLSYDKIKKYFDKEGRPIGKDMNFKSGGYLWTLYIQKRPSAKSGNELWKIYGVNGDYTFGLAPGYYQQKLSGNKRAAKDVYNQFITKYLK